MPDRDKKKAAMGSEKGSREGGGGADVGNEGGAKGGATKRRKKAAVSAKVKRLPPYNVVLLNDDDHTYEYVIAMLSEIFGFKPEKGYQLAKVVDKDGRAIVMTTHRELAELKCDQIIAYGADIRVAACKGSMNAVIEPAK